MRYLSSALQKLKSDFVVVVVVVVVVRSCQHCLS